MKGLGDSVALNAAELPEIKLGLAGFDMSLDRVSLLSDPLPSNCPGCTAMRQRLIQPGGRCHS